MPSESETGRSRRVAAAIVTALEDVICLLAASVALLLILYATNDGQFRLSAVVTMLLGYLLYRVTLKRRLGVLLASVRAVLSLTGVWILAVVSYPARKLLAFLWGRTRPIRARIAQTLRAVRLTLKERAKKAPPQEPTAAASTRPPNGRHYFSKGSNKNNR